MKRNQLIGAGISFGLAVGAFISIFLGDFAFWIAVGICLGTAAGAGWSKLSSRGDAAPNDEKRAADVETEADKARLGCPFNRSAGFASTGGSAKVAPMWADVRVVSAARDVPLPQSTPNSG